MDITHLKGVKPYTVLAHKPETPPLLFAMVLKQCNHSSHRNSQMLLGVFTTHLLLNTILCLPMACKLLTYPTRPYEVYLWLTLLTHFTPLPVSQFNNSTKPTPFMIHSHPAPHPYMHFPAPCLCPSSPSSWNLYQLIHTFSPGLPNSDWFPKS